MNIIECVKKYGDVTFAEISDMEKYYSKEKQRQYGVVGIEIAIKKI